MHKPWTPGDVYKYPSSHLSPIDNNHTSHNANKWLSLVGVTPDKSDILMGTVVIVRGPNIDKGKLMDANWTTVPVPADGGKRLSSFRWEQYLVGIR